VLKEKTIRKTLSGFLLSAALTLGFTVEAHAGSITFDFNALANGASDSSVQSNMQTVVNQQGPGGGTVTVSGAVASNNYAGEGYVVGPVSGGPQWWNQFVVPVTLGTTDGGVSHGGSNDTFLINDNLNGHGSDRITIAFSFKITSVSFDYEIFPNGNCPAQTSHGNCNNTSSSNWPDFTLTADGVTKLHTTGIVPGQSGTYSHSPNSGPFFNETAPQFLGTSGTILFSGSGVNTLQFIDWPPEIGIDNLVVNYDSTTLQGGPSPVPEPSSMILFGVGLLCLRLVTRKIRQGEI
jgi:hypothetical protein